MGKAGKEDGLTHLEEVINDAPANILSREILIVTERSISLWPLTNVDRFSTFAGPRVSLINRNTLY